MRYNIILNKEELSSLTLLTGEMSHDHFKKI